MDHHLQSGHPLVDFHGLAPGKDAAVNTGVQTPFRVPASDSFGHRQRSGIAGSCGDSTFHVLRNVHTVLDSSCPIFLLTPVHEGSRLPTSWPRPAAFCLIQIGTLTGVKWSHRIFEITYFLEKTSWCPCLIGTELLRAPTSSPAPRETTFPSPACRWVPVISSSPGLPVRPLLLLLPCPHPG